MINKTLKKTTFLLLGIFLLNTVSAKGLSNAKAFSAANDFLLKANARNLNFTKIYRDKTIEINIGSEITARVFQLQPVGYIVVSSYGKNSPVIGYSFDEDFPNEKDLAQHPLLAIIEGINESRKHENAPGEKKEVTSSAKAEFYGPWVNTLWGQVNCHNNNGDLINVTNLYTPNNYAPGCVAVSMATLLHHYKWPIWGVGSHAYTDNSGSSTGYYTANFGGTYYDWEHMRNKYRNQSSTLEEREAAGELAFHCAVALEMDFEYNGSTSNVNWIPGCGDDYFRFHSFYKQESSSIFWGRLDKNMMEANPVILSISGSGNIGHSVVCDGLNIDGNDYFYHLNMGWWGVGNGWFTIRDDFNTGGYTAINGGVLDFIPIPIMYDAQLLYGSDMFNLNWQFTQTIAATDYDVQRKINDGDWETIAENYQDTTLLVIIDDISNEYYFRVRAKVNDEIYSYSWSNEIHLDILTGTDETLSDENLIRVSPNPFVNSFTLDLNKTVSVGSSISIYNVTGELVYQLPEMLRKLQLTIQANEWDNGVYFIRLDSGTESTVKKIVKY